MNSPARGACVAFAWLLVSVVAGFSFLALLQSQPTGEHWFSPDDNGVNPSLDETIGFVAAFLISGGFSAVAMLVVRRAFRLALGLAVSILLWYFLGVLVTWVSIGILLNQLRPWGAGPQEIEVARADAIACVASAGVLGCVVGFTVAVIVLLIGVLPQQTRGRLWMLAFLLAIVVAASSFADVVRGVLKWFLTDLRTAFGSNMPDVAVVGAPTGVLVGTIIGLLLAELLARGALCQVRPPPTALEPRSA